MGNCDSCASPRSHGLITTKPTFKGNTSIIPEVRHERVLSYNEETDNVMNINHVNYRIIPFGHKPSETQPSTHSTDKIRKHMGI